MGGAVGGAVMAKKKGRPRGPGGEGAQVRIDSDLASMARYVAAQQGVSLTQFLSQLLRPAVEREFKKLGKKFLGEKED
jgi:hypothetical protein